MLGRMIDDRVRRMGNFGGQSEARMLLFATLVMADELHEAHRNLPAPGTETGDTDREKQAIRLTALAERLEKLASHLETGAIHP